MIIRNIKHFWVLFGLKSIYFYIFIYRIKIKNSILFMQKQVFF